MDKETEVKQIMESLNKEIDALKIEMAKANEKKIRNSAFNCSALHRTRKLLISIEKLGFAFRKASVAYQKELRSE